MAPRLPPYMLGLVDGFELALRIHRKHFDGVPKEWASVRRALRTYTRDVQHALDMVQTHRLGETAAYFGFDAGWRPDRIARLRGILPLEVEIDETTPRDADEEDA